LIQNGECNSRLYGCDLHAEHCRSGAVCVDIWRADRQTTEFQ
jgi:hypothetical protein